MTAPRTTPLRGLGRLARRRPRHLPRHSTRSTPPTRPVATGSPAVPRTRAAGPDGDPFQTALFEVPLLDGPLLDGPLLDGPLLDGPLLDGPWPAPGQLEVPETGPEDADALLRSVLTALETLPGGAGAGPSPRPGAVVPD